MIPKTIHYCWLSGDKKPRLIQQCIDSWSRVMPEYKIKCWDKNSFDCDSIQFVQEALSVKQYAAASDYIRLYALYTEGGIYLDSDVLVKKSFDIFLKNDFFCGTEAFYSENKPKYRMEAAIMGATKRHSFLKECMSYYERTSFIKKNGGYDNHNVVMPIVISKFAERYGYIYIDEFQNLTQIVIYPTSYFTNTLIPNSTKSDSIYAIHQNAGSWIDYSDRGWLFRFCKKHDLTHLYHFIENIRK